MAKYEDLMVYRKAYALVLQIYEATKAMPTEEQYGLTSQMRRAAVGIPLTIAEGYGKSAGDRETKRFLLMARGSTAELHVLLHLAKDVGYMEKGKSERLIEAYEEVGKMLTGLIHSINQ